MQIGAEGSFNFSGSGLEVYTWLGPDGGEIEILLDDISKGVFSQFNSGGDLYDQMIFKQINLTSGYHTMNIRAVNNGWTMIDYLRILSEPAPGRGLPLEVQLDQNYPNPFNSATIIQYQLPVDSWVMVKIYDINGRLVRTFDESQMAAGTNSLWWDGMNEEGQLVSSGVYFYILRVSREGNESTLYGKAVLLR